MYLLRLVEMPHKARLDSFPEELFCLLLCLAMFVAVFLISPCIMPYPDLL